MLTESKWKKDVDRVPLSSGRETRVDCDYFLLAKSIINLSTFPSSSPSSAIVRPTLAVVSVISLRIGDQLGLEKSLVATPRQWSGSIKPRRVIAEKSLRSVILEVERKRTASHHGARNNFSPKHFRDYMLYNKSVSDPETCLAKTNLPRGIKDNFVGTPKSRHHNKTKSEDESRERRKK